MEETRRRALKLVDIIASSKLPWSKAIEEVEQDLTEVLKNADLRIRKEIRERIHGLKRWDSDG